MSDRDQSISSNMRNRVDEVRVFYNPSHIEFMITAYLSYVLLMLL